jgi:hypothetical protein
MHYQFNLVDTWIQVDRVVKGPASVASLPAARTSSFGRHVRPVTYPGAVPEKVTESPPPIGARTSRHP